MQAPSFIRVNLAISLGLAMISVSTADDWPIFRGPDLDGISKEAGRSKADDVIDPTVGFDELIKVGTKVSAGEVLGRVHAADVAGAEAGEYALKEAISCE